MVGDLVDKLFVVSGLVVGVFNKILFFFDTAYLLIFANLVEMT